MQDRNVSMAKLFIPAFIIFLSATSFQDLMFRLNPVKFDLHLSFNKTCSISFPLKYYFNVLSVILQFTSLTLDSSFFCLSQWYSCWTFMTHNSDWPSCSPKKCHICQTFKLAAMWVNSNKVLCSTRVAQMKWEPTCIALGGKQSWAALLQSNTWTDWHGHSVWVLGSQSNPQNLHKVCKAPSIKQQCLKDYRYPHLIWISVKAWISCFYEWRCTKNVTSQFVLNIAAIIWLECGFQMRAAHH